MKEQALSVWAIYDHPKDYPDMFMARRFEGDQPTDDVVLGASLDGLRKTFRRMGKVCIPRAAADDPVIVETWL